MNAQKEKVQGRKRRHRRVRRNVFGTSERPRLVVFSSLKHIYSQLIDDSTGRTLVCASTQTPDVRSQFSYGGNVKAAVAVGELVARLAKQAGYSKIVFDRAGYKYHGRIKALAESARKAGLQF